MHIEEFISRFARVKKNGSGYQACCPSHDDQQQSLSISPGNKGGIVLKCFAGCDTKDILGEVGCTFADIQPPKVEPLKKQKTLTIDKVYQYQNEDGYPVFEVVRYKPKTFRQRTMKDGQVVYNTEGIVKPLYRLPELLQAIEAQRPIFYCEGEKDVETLRAHGLDATTHCGGAAAWASSPQYVDVLKRAKHLYILPDNDKAGNELAYAIRKDLPHAEIIRLKGLPDKGDATDWFNNGGNAELLLKEVDDLRNRGKAPAAEHGYFKCLGYNGDYFYFLPSGTKQVKSLTAPELAQRAHLYTLAPREHFEDDTFYGGLDNARGGRDFCAVADLLMRQCMERGIYTNDLRRGMGAWIDDGRTVLHIGSSLYVDGTPCGLLDIKSRYVYEARAGSVTLGSSAISDDEAEEFVSLCLMPYWEDDIYGRLLAGWMACAPICGTLKWRPHIWINGPAGCGKSYIATNIVGRVLSGVIRQFASSTTEAGIRQKLASDSLPVLFDEAEGDTRGARENINRILELMRHSSSDSDALITKGSRGGISTDFAIRSMFCMASIAHGINRRADESRTTILRLADSSKRQNAREAFEELADTIYRILTPDFASGFVARSCANAKTIRANAETLAKVLGETEGGRRYGDQVGTMLAGYYSLSYPGEITANDARILVDRVNLSALASPDMDKGKDEEQCLRHLLEHQVRVDGVSVHASYTDTVGNLIAYCVRQKTTQLQHDTLERIGIRVDHDMGVMVSNTHKGLAHIYQNSAFCGQWGTYLKRMDGVTSGKAAAKFAGSPSRYVILPFTYFD